jgi:segregation and condensation protein A
VSFQVAGHQTEGYQISTDVYEGPLDLLLSLIERAELDITTLALAQVTDQYLEYLKKLEDRDPAEVSAFLVIASRLVQIKSAVLLPRPPAIAQIEEEDPGESLAQQLIIYRRFKQLAGWLVERQEAGLRTYLRLSTPTPRLDPHADLSDFSLEDLVGIARQVFLHSTSLPELSQVVSMPRVTIREKITSILSILRREGKATFWELAGSRSRLDLVVTFLAMLELIKRNVIEVQQSDAFGDILLQPLGTLGEEPGDSGELEFGD